MTGDEAVTGYALIFLAGFLPTVVWRWAGVALAGKISADGEVLIWVRAVATALIAAVMAKLLLYPSGALADIPLTLRLAATAIGFALFIVSGQRVLVGVVSAEIMMFLGHIVFVS